LAIIPGVMQWPVRSFA